MAANTPVATAACRYLRMSSRYGMKISGVSFTPAAIPMPSPCHQRVRPARRERAAGEQVRHDEQHEQQVDLAEGEGLLDGFGGQRERGDAQCRAQPDRGPVPVSRARRIRATVDRPRAARLARVIAQRMAVQDSTEATEKITAANGG